MNSYYVYIVCCDDGSYYTGITNDVDRRVAEHNLGLDERGYTFTRRPVHLVFAADFREVQDAIRFEKEVKGWRRAKKIAMIEGRWGDLRALAVSRGAHGTPHMKCGDPSTGSG